MQEAHHLPRSKCSLCWWGEGGVPHPVMNGRYPIQSWTGGVPQDTPLSQVWLGGGTPSSLGLHPFCWWGGYPGIPPSWSWMGYLPPPISRMGYPSCLDLGRGTPPTPSGPGMGYPLPPATGNRLKLLPSLILRMRAVKMVSSVCTSSITPKITMDPLFHNGWLTVYGNSPNASFWCTPCAQPYSMKYQIDHWVYYPCGIIVLLYQV